MTEQERARSKIQYIVKVHGAYSIGTVLVFNESVGKYAPPNIQPDSGELFLNKNFVETTPEFFEKREPPADDPEELKEARSLYEDMFYKIPAPGATKHMEQAAKECAVVAAERIIQELVAISVAESGVEKIDYGQSKWRRIKSIIINL